MRTHIIEASLPYMHTLHTYIAHMHILTLMSDVQCTAE